MRRMLVSKSGVVCMHMAPTATMAGDQQDVATVLSTRTNSLDLAIARRLLVRTVPVVVGDEWQLLDLRLCLLYMMHSGPESKLGNSSCCPSSFSV